MSTERLKWLERCGALNVEGPKKESPAAAAPHKPLLLLVVCDLADEGRLEGGFLQRDGALAFRFALLWRVVADRRRTKPDLRLPFFHLKTDGFWQPLDETDRPAASRDVAAKAQLDRSFLVCLCEAGFRDLVRRTLIAKYFQATERAELYSLCRMEIPPEDVIAADATRFLPSDHSEKKRDAKFAARVLPAYDFTCALTGYRMIGVDGSTPLDAAHIHQFSCGGSCHPTNGLALSKSAHWLFDRGFWSLTDDYRILVAKQRFDEAGEAAHLLKPRAGLEIQLPRHHLLHPDLKCVQWHRDRHGFRV